MIEFCLIGIIVVWAIYRVWKTVWPGGGCSCGGQCSACDGRTSGSCPPKDQAFQAINNPRSNE